jgi:hypothetical protein
MFAQMNGERDRLLSGIISLTYFMRGSIQYKDMFEMSYVERQAVGSFIEKRLEIESKKMYAQY